MKFSNNGNVGAFVDAKGRIRDIISQKDEALIVLHIHIWAEVFVLRGWLCEAILLAASGMVIEDDLCRVYFSNLRHRLESVNSVL